MTEIEQRIRAHVQQIEEQTDGPRVDLGLPQRLTRLIRRRRRVRAAGVAVTVMAIIGAVGVGGAQLMDGDGKSAPSDSRRGTLSESQARQFIVEVLSQQNVDPIASDADDATDYLPNRLFAYGDGPAQPLSDQVVVAEIVDVEEGEAYTPHNEPIDDWNNAGLGYKTVIVELDATPLTGDGESETITASLRVASSDGLDVWRTGLPSFGPVVAFLNSGSSLDDADYTLAGGGVTMLSIDENGALHAPFRPNWLNVAHTLIELRTEAERPPVTEQVPGGPDKF